jgi:methyl-accepting chemotaxis protein
MNKNNFLTDLKNEYNKTNATDHLKMSGWSDIADKIGASGPFYKRIFMNYFARVSLALIALLVVFFGTYQIALAALPGEPFYPVKILSEKIIEEVNGNNQVTIDHRADEIIDLSKEQEINSQNLEQVVAEYKENVDQAKQDFEVTGESSTDFQDKLEEQHLEFERISSDNPEIEDEIGDAKEASEPEEEETDD